MSPAHAALLNHLMLKSGCCWAQGGRYCQTGRELWLQYRAECVAEGGRDAMRTVRDQTPEWAEEIKRLALEVIGAERAAA